MATESASPGSGRPRPWLLVALGVVLTVFLFTKLWPTATPAPTPPRAQPRAAAKTGENGAIAPEQLKIQLEALKGPRPEPGEGERNPFRFYQKPPPPLPPMPPAPKTAAPPPEDLQPPGPPPPPPLPPIPLKFIGIVEGRGVGKIAAFSDCKRTFYGREGDIVDGRYKLVKIGVESVIMTYADGRGQQPIRLTGQDCIVK
jgi:hypothetical protein